MTQCFSRAEAVNSSTWVSAASARCSASASFCCPWKRGKTPVRQVTAQDTERAERETLKWRDGLEEAAVIDPVFDEGNPVRRTRRAACCSRSASSVDCLKCPTTRCLPAR